MDEAGNWLHRAEAWHRTGDCAKSDDKGAIVVTGRADSSVNHSGYLILLADIEKALETLDSVIQAIVIPIHSESIQGGDSGNARLAESRAAFVRETLVAIGIDRSLFTVRVMGVDQKAHGDCPKSLPRSTRIQCFSMSRRVDISVKMFKIL